MCGQIVHLVALSGVSQIIYWQLWSPVEQRCDIILQYLTTAHKLSKTENCFGDISWQQKRA